MNHGYIVLDTDTGWMDGVYSEENMARGAKERWSDRLGRPCLLVKIVDQHPTYPGIPDHMFMAEAVRKVDS